MRQPRGWIIGLALGSVSAWAWSPNRIEAGDLVYTPENEAAYVTSVKSGIARLRLHPAGGERDVDVRHLALGTAGIEDSGHWVGQTVYLAREPATIEAFFNDGAVVLTQHSNGATLVRGHHQLGIAAGDSAVNCTASFLGH